MDLQTYRRERLACAYFYISCGLAYGVFTARMPALKQLTHASDGGIGFLLLAFGGASFCGLLASKSTIARYGPQSVTALASLLFMGAFVIASIAWNYWQLLGFGLLAGLGTGFCDVGMNAQGMMIEKRHNVLCMASLHACFSLGGMAGALSGSLFAALALSPFINFLVVCGVCAIFWPWAVRNSIPGSLQGGASKKTPGRLPRMIYFFGMMSMLCYVSEGSVGEWGSVLLHSVKDAPQDVAALVFAVFCVPMVICRFLADKLRAKAGDFIIVLCGSLISLCGMAWVLLSPWPVFCLGGYMAMGIGFAPIVPILYSRAGSLPGIDAGRASSAMSLLSYTGLLFFPPFLGMLGDAIGLGNALWIIVGLCACVAAGSVKLKARL